MFQLRNRRHLILLAYIVAVVLLSLIDEFFAILIAPVAFPRFRSWLYRMFFSQMACPTCGKTIPLVGSWRCGGCGFVQHRHAYQPCAKCRVSVGEVPCPHCDHGMFL